MNKRNLDKILESKSFKNMEKYLSRKHKIPFSENEKNIIKQRIEKEKIENEKFRSNFVNSPLFKLALIRLAKKKKAKVKIVDNRITYDANPIIVIDTMIKIVNEVNKNDKPTKLKEIFKIYCKNRSKNDTKI